MVSVLFIDEAAALLRNAGFASLVQVDMYREYRKLGGAVVMAFAVRETRVRY